MTTFFLRGTRAILAPPSGPPNPAMEPGSILVKGEDGRLKLVGSMHALVGEANKDFFLRAESDLIERDCGEGTTTLRLGRKSSAAFWASIFKFRGFNEPSSSYILECTGTKQRTLRNIEEVLRRFTEDIDMGSILMPKSGKIAVVTSVYRGTSVDVRIGTSDRTGGNIGITVPTEVTGALPASVGVGAVASSTLAGRCTWKASSGNSLPVAIQGRVLQFEKSGLLKSNCIFGFDGRQDGEDPSQQGDDDATEEESDDGGLSNFLYGEDREGLPQWTSP